MERERENERLRKAIPSLTLPTGARAVPAATASGNFAAVVERQQWSATDDRHRRAIARVASQGLGALFRRGDGWRAGSCRGCERAAEGPACGDRPSGPGGGYAVLDARSVGCPAFLGLVPALRHPALSLSVAAAHDDHGACATTVLRHGGLAAVFRTALDLWRHFEATTERLIIKAVHTDTSDAETVATPIGVR